MLVVIRALGAGGGRLRKSLVTLTYIGISEQLCVNHTLSQRYWRGGSLPPLTAVPRIQCPLLVS